MKLIALTAAIILSGGIGNAQSEFTPRPGKVFISASSSDLDASVKWYEKFLKMKLADRTDYPDLGYRQANLSGALGYIELKQFDTAMVSGENFELIYSKKKSGITEAGFVVSDFGDWVVFLLLERAQIVDEVSADRVTGKRALTISDPDGNHIRLVEE